MLNRLESEREQVVDEALQKQFSGDLRLGLRTLGKVCVGVGIDFQFMTTVAQSTDSRVQYVVQGGMCEGVCVCVRVRVFVRVW